MKVGRIIGVLSLAATFAFLAGCNKQDQTTTSSAPDASTAPAPTASAAPAPAADTAIQAAPAIAPAPATDAAAAAATTATAQAQGLIDQAKTLTDNSQYADASKIVQQLSTMQLTPDQQKMVDDLKALIQKKLADQGAGAVGGLLNK